MNSINHKRKSAAACEGSEGGRQAGRVGKRERERERERRRWNLSCAAAAIEH